MGSLQDQYKDIKDEQTTEQDQAALKREKKQLKAEKKKRKCIARIDRQLTEIFNRLNDDKKILKALRNNNGEIKQSIGGYNTLSQYFKSAFGFIGRVEDEANIKEALKNNQALKAFTKRLESEGFTLSISTKAHGPETHAGKFLGGVVTAYGVALASTAFWPSFFIASFGLGIVKIDNGETAKVILNIKEKAPIKETEQDNTLLDQLNSLPIKQAEKQHAPIR